MAASGTGPARSGPGGWGRCSRGRGRSGKEVPTALPVQRADAGAVSAPTGILRAQRMAGTEDLASS